MYGFSILAIPGLCTDSTKTAMKISRNWLQKYFEKPLPSAEALADALTFHSFEIESIEGDVLDVRYYRTGPRTASRTEALRKSLLPSSLSR